MHEEDATSLNAPSNRRAFISLTISGMGAALVACTTDRAASDTSKVPRDTTRAASGTAIAPNAHQNSDSRLDSAVLKDVKHGTTTAGAAQGAATPTYHRIAPELPPIPAGNVQKLHWHAKQAPVRLSDDTVVAAWTFEGDVPGPFVHTRVGDTVEFTLTNDVDVPHSMDFHAAQIDPRIAFRSVAKGESVTFTFKPKYAGAFMYHCGTAPVLMHIGSGMHGAIIVSPAQPLPPAKEFVLVQSELYLADAAAGVRAFDYTKMLSTFPDFVVFNTRPNQYIKDPIKVKLR